MTSTRLTLRDFVKRKKVENFEKRIGYFQEFLSDLKKNKEYFFMRKVLSPMDREVVVEDGQQKRKMLMFGSNNYLGFANHPYIQEKCIEAIREFGTGVGGPPLLNGYILLVRQLEERLAGFKGKEKAIVFPSGYATNVGIFSALPSHHDMVFVDREHHASCFDGLELGSNPFKTWKHNEVDHLERLLQEEKNKRDTFIAIEGVYSMKGDLSPLQEVVQVAKKYGSYLILDDAHGTGVMEQNGKGTAHHFGVAEEVDLLMGTFSKTFSIAGGFAAGGKELIDYLRYFAHPYVFSGGITPLTAATVLAGLDLLEKDQSIVQKLHSNIVYFKELCRSRCVPIREGESAIFTLPVPLGKDIRKMVCEFHEKNIFVNAIEYPAVLKGDECFRISLSAVHTKEDLERLVGIIEDIL